MDFSQKLRNIRKENAMSQEDFAEQLGVSRQAVSKWESGQGFPETEKLLQISSMFGVSLDYLLKEEGDSAAPREESGYYVSREMAEGFLLSKRQGAMRIAVGVAVILLSIIFIFVFGDVLGVVLFLLGVATGVGIIVASAFHPNRYKEMESQPLLFDGAFIREFKSAYASRRKKYGYLIVAGIVIVLVSVAFAVMFEWLPEAYAQKAPALLPLCWAAAVFLFINAGSALGAEGIIANNGEHLEEIKKEKKNGWIWGAIMPLAAMVYLMLGFIWNAWHPGWLVFPIASLLGTAIIGFTNSRSRD